MKHDSYGMTLLEDELYALCSESYPQPVQDWVGRIRSAAVEPMKLAQYIIDNAWITTDSEARQEELQRDIARSIKQYIKLQDKPKGGE